MENNYENAPQEETQSTQPDSSERGKYKFRVFKLERKHESKLSVFIWK